MKINDNSSLFTSEYRERFYFRLTVAVAWFYRDGCS